jgi:hypothetical protein
MRKTIITLVWGLLLMSLALPAAAQEGLSLRFYGYGRNDVDRVKIRLTSTRPVNIGAGDFTIEFWMRAYGAENPSGPCVTGNDAWIRGHSIIDRDVFGPGDYGDYGISLYGGRIAFGTNNGSSGASICGATNVADGDWHHIAVTRRASDGRLQIYVDGGLDASGSGPTGNLSYRIGRSTAWENDPFIVIGAEKHDINRNNYPSYSGWLDELRISNTLRYTGAFDIPTGPFATDAFTVGLYHFDEGSGTTIIDSSGAAGGPSNGVLRYGGSPAGPVWSTDTPFESTPQRNYFTTASPLLTWGSVSWAISYEIQVADNPAFSQPFAFTNIVAGDVLEVIAPGLASGRYFWRVRAQRANATWGGWSAIDSFVIDTP